ncbi:helicase-associated domain-containing protein [Kitasatospora mediocidica]|uniref:helicase-associated domain-containing protein n=1 Tax=Kitasatospora mediocidica TaxID=58352 RepID=UPI00068FA9C7|nr:helicase-associated domain-containing protein [Kitasatospora mediocidica]
MNSTTALTSWLTGRTPTQLVELLEQRELPYAGGTGLTSPARLARHLLGDASVTLALRGLDQAQLQVLAAVAVLAEQLHGPAPAPVERAGPAGFTGWAPAGQSAEPPLECSERAVPRARLRAALAAPTDAPGAALDDVLEQLAERALLLPPHGSALTVPPLLHRRAAELQGYGRPVATLLSSAYKAAEIHRVAAELHLGATSTRDVVQQLIVERLTDREAVRRLTAQAPAAAARLLERLVPGPPLLRTQCFVSEHGVYYSATSKFRFREAGSDDPGADWLAARGLLIPVGPDLCELPHEVAAALRDEGAPLAYDPAPPPVPAARPLPAHQTGEAQAVATATATRVELLLRATAAQPLAVRKAGGIAVRDTRRLAKLTGASDAQTRLWLDLGANAGLIAPHRDVPPPTRSRKPAPLPPARILPTARYDRWLAGSPAERLVPLIATWAVTPEVFSAWPDDSEIPVALVAPQDRSAVELRRTLLEALAGLPAGTGLGPAAALGEEALAELVVAASWYRPAVGPDPFTLERAAATLAEAELLGVVAHGALTPVGHATLGLLRAGADRYFPAVPGAGTSLAGRPALAAAVAALRTALEELVPPPRTTARFQADLTAVVSGPAAPELTELLGSVGTRESEGHAVVWRIGAASVRRALDSGADAQELLTRLAEVSEGGRALPQPLTYLVNDAARTHGRIRVVRSACCIRSDDEALVTELSQARVLAKLGLRRIAPTVLISTASPTETLAALRLGGYAPVLEAETGTTVVERAPDERAAVEMPSLAGARTYYGGGPGTPEALAAELLSGKHARAGA